MSSETNNSANNSGTGLLLYVPPQVKSFAEEQNAIKEEKAAVVSKGSEAKPAAIQACVMPHSNKPAKAAPTAKDLCKFTSLYLHLPGGKTLVLPADGPKTIELIAGYNSKAEEISCKVIGKAGPCSMHKSKIFDVTFKPDLLAKPTDDELRFKARSVPFYKAFHNGTIIPWHAKKSSYVINARTCDVEHNISKEIIIYPDIKIDIDIPIYFKNKPEEKAVLTNSGKNARVYKETVIEQELKAKYQEDGTTYEYSQQFKEKLETIREVAALTDKIKKVVEESLDSCCVFEIEPMQGKLHFEFEFKKEGEYKVEPEWNALLQLKPAIGAKWKVKLDEAVLQLANKGVGKMYHEMKKRLEGHDTAEFGLDFSAEGNLNVDLGIKKEAGKPEQHFGAGVSGKLIELMFKAYGSYNIKTIIHFQAAAEASILANLSYAAFIHKREGGIDVDTKLEFSGFKWHINVHVGGHEKTKTKNKKTGKDEVTKDKYVTIYDQEGDFYKPEKPIYEHTFQLG